MPELYPRQQLDARTLASRHSGALWYEAGLGKTPTGIRLAMLAGEHESWGIVTLRDALPNWEKELAAWAPGRGSTVTLTHYEALQKPEIRARLAAAGVLLLDEAHVTRDIETLAFKNCYAITRPLPYRMRKIYQLDATPLYNGVKDLAAPLILGDVLALSEYKNFLWRYTDPQLGGLNSYFDYSEPRNLPELARSIHAFGIRRTYRDMGRPLPPLYPTKLRVTLEGPAADEYNKAAKDFGTWYTRGNAGADAPGLARFTVLRRLQSLALVPAAAARTAQHLRAGGNVLLFTGFRESAEQLHKQFKGAHLVLGGQAAGERDEIFSGLAGSPNGRLVVATYGALAAALNLQALDRVIFVDDPWTPAAIDQLFKRAWRNLQPRAVYVDFFDVPGDQLRQQVRAVLLKKTDLLIKLGLAPTGNLRQISY